MSIIDMQGSRYWMDILIKHSTDIMNLSGIVDTGAKGTIIRQSVLKVLPGMIPIREHVARRGAVPGASRFYSEYEVYFIVADKVLDNVHIFVPEDDKHTTNLIGIDVLSRIDLYQLSNSYRLNYTIKEIQFSEECVNYSNVNEALMYILKEKKRSDLFPVLHQYIPVDINMSSDNFYVLVSRMLRKLHMT